MTMQVELTRIELLPTGRLALTLRDDPAGRCPSIYRAAAEIEWQPVHSRFISPRPELGSPSAHYVHVARAVREELGYVLVPDASTKWVNVPSEDRAVIEGQLAQPGT